MKYFVTGASGFVGQNMLQRYKDVVPFYRQDNLADKLSKSKPDVIINCVAEIYQEDVMWQSNVEFTKHCLDYVRDNPHVRMVQLGSSSEYGDSATKTNECSLTNPDSYYGLTKLIATNTVVHYTKTFKLRAFVVRPYSVFGIGEKPHRLFPKLLSAFKYNKQIDLVNGVHDFCYIRDFLDGIDLVLDSDKFISGEIINISNGEQISNLELYDTFKKVFGTNGKVNLIDKFVTYKHWQCDNSHIKTKYGWCPKFNLHNAVEEFSKTNYYE